MAKYWKQNGVYIKHENGGLESCDDCPCGELCYGQPSPVGRQVSISWAITGDASTSDIVSDLFCGDTSFYTGSATFDVIDSPSLWNPGNPGWRISGIGTDPSENPTENPCLNYIAESDSSCYDGNVYNWYMDMRFDCVAGDFTIGINPVTRSTGDNCGTYNALGSGFIVDFSTTGGRPVIDTYGTYTATGFSFTVPSRYLPAFTGGYSSSDDFDVTLTGTWI